MDGLRTSTAPTITSSNWVRKSMTARKTLRPADSRMPTMFTADSRTTTTMPQTMSPGLWRRAFQNSPPM